MYVFTQKRRFCYSNSISGSFTAVESDISGTGPFRSSIRTLLLLWPGARQRATRAARSTSTDALSLMPGSDSEAGHWRRESGEWLICLPGRVVGIWSVCLSLCLNTFISLKLKLHTRTHWNKSWARTIWSLDKVKFGSAAVAADVGAGAGCSSCWDAVGAVADGGTAIENAIGGGGAAVACCGCVSKLSLQSLFYEFEQPQNTKN